MSTTSEDHNNHAREDQRSPLLTWVPLLVVAGALIAVTRRGASPIRDPDAWWHLRVGSLLRDGEISLHATEPLSRFATESWVPRDWIPQLISSQVESWFGLPGVAWLYGLALVVFVVLSYVGARTVSSPVPASLAVALGLWGALASLTQRPQMVSFILLHVVMIAWLRTAGNGRPRWWLIPLTWIWASSHGYWYFGIGVGIAVTIGMMLDGFHPRGTLLKLAGLNLLTVTAAGLTPAGPPLLWSAFTTGDKWQFVSEWAPPDFGAPSPLVAASMAGLVVVLWSRREDRVKWVDLGLMAVAVVCLLLAARTVTLGAIILTYLLASAIQRAMYSTRQPIGLRQEGTSLALMGTSALIYFGVVLPENAAEPADVPLAMNGNLRSLPPGTAILNDYGLGGWLHWEHPHLDTVIDGFTDGYTVDAINAYLDALQVKPGWEEYVDEMDTSVAVLKEESPLAEALTSRLNWIIEESDAGYVLLLQP